MPNRKEARLSPTTLARAEKLKRQLIEFAESDALAHVRAPFIAEQLSAVKGASPDTIRTAIDRFAIGNRLADGDTVIGLFLREHTDLSAEDARIVAQWSDCEESLFEVIRSVAGLLTVVNLVNDLNRNIHVPDGDPAAERVAEGCFMHARLLPIEEGWMLSTPPTLFLGAQRESVHRHALQLASVSPAMVFKNPEKLAQAWTLQHSDREEFIQYFGSDMVSIPVDEVVSRMRDYMRFKSFESRDSDGLTRVERARREGRPLPPTPEPDVGEIPEGVETVGFVYDELEGQLQFYDLARVVNAFENPDLCRQPEVSELIRDYVENPELSPAPLHRLAAIDSTKATQAVRIALNLPQFEWARDADELLRAHKSDYIDQTHYPSVIPVGDRLTAPAAANQTVVRIASSTGRKIGRNEPCLCRSGKKYKFCCGR